MLASLIALDVSLLNSIRQTFLPEPGSLGVMLVHILADIQIFIVAIVLVAVWLLGTVKKNNSYKEAAFDVAACLIFGLVVYLLLNSSFPLRPRPESVTAIPPLLSHIPDNSFPSGHAVFFAASLVGLLFTTRFPLRAWMISLFAVSGTLMCLARIIAGVHYPLDIIAGFAFGAFAVSIFALYIPKTHTYASVRLSIVRLVARIGL